MFCCCNHPVFQLNCPRETLTTAKRTWLESLPTPREGGERKRKEGVFLPGKGFLNKARDLW